MQQTITKSILLRVIFLKTGTLDSGLGSGPDICYPSEHEKLYGEIIKNGCIVSEYPPGTLPRNYTFPARNRLIAALSDEIVVIDAGAHSGTESTVRAAVKYGRRVESI
jgi:DNA processing protein